MYCLECDVKKGYVMRYLYLTINRRYYNDIKV